FGSKDVGTRTATATGLALSGTDAGDYHLTNSSDTDDAQISAKDVSAKISASGKVYDGSTDAAYSCNVVGKVSGDAVTCDGVHPAHFGSKDVGTRTATASGLALSGTDAGDYHLTNSSDTDDAQISAKDVSAKISASGKVYDGSTDAAYGCAVQGKVASDAVTCDGVHPAHFGSKDVGTRTATASGLALSGTDAGDYHLTNSSDTDDAQISAKDVSAKISASGKVYDGSTDAAYGCAVKSKVPSDAVPCDGDHVAHLRSKNVGTRTATASGLALSGTDAGNYPLTNPRSKDASYALTCEGDRHAHFGSKDVGTRTATASGLAFSGTDAADYHPLTPRDAHPVQISAKDVSAKISASGKVYDGSTDAAYGCAV